MKKGVIFLSILLVASIAGTYAVYELYVKQRMKELADHLERERQLAVKIESLQTTFFGTTPQVVLQEWRNATQPWSDALERRTAFFAFDRTVERVTIPEGQIPRFYYRDELPKRIQALQEYAERKNVQVADVTCGVPPFDFYRAGSNPPASEIEQNLLKFDQCAALTRMLVDVGPESIQPLVFWPDVDTKLRSGGTLRERTTGIRMRARMQSLVTLLDSVSQSDRYFRVNGLKVSNPDLTVQDPTLDVELLLTQARFVPEERRTTQAAASPDAARQAQANVANLFSQRATDSRSSDDDNRREGPTFWQRFRKKYIPF